MSDRHALCASFLATTPWAGARLTPLAPDASTRRYFRLTPPDQGPAVLLDADPATGLSSTPFLRMTQRLRGLGLSAPKIHAQDTTFGLILMEDLGDALFATHLKASPGDEDLLYGQAVDLLADLQRRETAPEELPLYDPPLYLRETLQVLDWYAPAAQRAPSEAARATFQAILLSALAELSPPQTCVLLDYHAENLLWLPDRRGLARCGLLDYQDARFGHPAYDLVSLLEDARRDTTPALRARMISRYKAATGCDDPAFDRAYATLGAQRNLKILGIFARHWVQHCTRRYLDLMPRVWAHLQNDLSHPELTDLQDWVTQHLPPPGALSGSTR